MSAARGRANISSTVVSTSPGPRSSPFTLLTPTFATSASVPVFTGHRSTPGCIPTAALAASLSSDRQTLLAAALTVAALSGSNGGRSAKPLIDVINFTSPSILSYEVVARPSGDIHDRSAP